LKIKCLKRDRINSILSDIVDYPITIVEAPMGFGKTSAVRNFLESKKIQHRIITFQNLEESADVFWSKFACEVEKLDEAEGKTLKNLGFPIDVPQREKVIALLSNLELNQKTVFVFDDYHPSNSLQLNKVILQVAAENIENFHIVIITRDTTNLNFTELFSKGLCQVISQQQLKFTDAEIREYCAMMTKYISDYDLKKIIEYTDGWISLIYMLLLALEKGIPVGINKTIDELIEKTLFSVYDNQIRDFLMKLATMDSFTEKQALFITEEKRTNELLNKLHKENSFIYYDEVNNTYKIHNVLLDFLRMKQNFEECEHKRLLKRLGEWYLEKQEFIKAYSYLYKAGETELILSHLNNPENICNELTGFEGSFEMFDKASEELLFKYPLACLQDILYSIVKGTEDTIKKCLKLLDKLQEVYEQMENIEPAYKNRILAEIRIIRKIARFNHLEQSTTDNDLILELLNGEQSYIMVEEGEFTFGSPNLLYVYFRDQGTFKRISEIIINKFPIYSKYANGCGTGSEYLAMAEYALETGDLESAKLNSFKAIYKARTKNQYSVIICANFNLIRLYIFQGKINEGIEMLKQLEQEIAGVSNPVYNTTIDLCKGYIYANLGQPQKIPCWLQNGDMSASDFLCEGVAFNYLVYGKAAISQKNYAKLEMLSESFVEYFSMFSNQLGFIHNGIFEAIAKFQLYGMEAGAEALNKVLDKGRADGIIMPFVENANYIMDVLNVIAKQNPSNEYVERVLHFSRKYSKSLKSMESISVTLTQREKEVLTLAAEGLSREKIAAQLYMSSGTVKTHLQNIY
jgi:LuxR family maltose regulon positive regulatory protein